jgi:hypothetical protein
MQKLDKPLKQQVKPKVANPKISEPIDKLVTEEELQAPIPSDQEVVFMGKNKKYNPDSNAKTITVLEDGTVIYSY